jgi:hypothetical protein
MPESDGNADGDHDTASALAEVIVSEFTGWPSVSKLDSDDTVTLRLGYFVYNSRDTRGVTVQAHHGGRQVHDNVTAVTERIEPLLDQRKFTVSTDQPLHRQRKTWDIGTVTIAGDGEIKSVDVDTEYLKPSVGTEAVDSESA